MSNKYLLFPFFGLGIPLLLYSGMSLLQNKTVVHIEPVGAISIKQETEVPPLLSSPTIIIVGDVLLARNVEFLMNAKGVDYPFKNTSDIFGTSSIVIGNFESAILENHKKTPSYVTTFSVDKKFLPYLKQAGFTHMGLANNHSLDYGQKIYEHTRQSLSDVEIVPVGYPLRIDDISTTIIVTGMYTVGVVAINQVSQAIDWQAAEIQIKKLAASTDYQIAYIHWGTEYVLTHNQLQQETGRKLIDNGIDAVVGHHPHVTQDIEIYNNKPIFYSLGNFIFDQYFSVDVEQGLVLQMQLSTSSVTYDLIPVSSEGTRSQPHKMTQADATLFLSNLARRSSSQYTENIKSGKLILPVSLATSVQNGMIAP